MTEDVQDMEDILSSIKSILEEDENKQDKASKADLDVGVVDDILDISPDDDILELSPDMMISEDNTEASNNTLEKQGTVLSDSDDASLISEINSFVNDSEDDNIVSIPALEEIDNNIALNDVEKKEETYADPVFAEYGGLDDSVANVQDNKINIINDNMNEEQSIDFINEIISETNQEGIDILVNEPSRDALFMETDDFNQDGFLEQEEVSETNINGNEEFISELAIDKNDEKIIDDANITLDQIYNPRSIIEELETSPGIDNVDSHHDTTDVSANIISNFAKMFSREDSNKVPSAESFPEVTSVGNVSKTLEEFVLDSVIKIVGKEISHQWNNGADFKEFAESEIIRQTKDWINDNLPSLVEKVVKQEIERVIAKVGS